MNIAVIGTSPHVTTWLRIFQERGEHITQTDTAPSAQDVYIFLESHPSLADVEQGVVVLDLRGNAGEDTARWIPYADICLIGEATTRDKLVQTYGCEPERIFVVPDGSSPSEEAQLADLIAQAAHDTLPPAVIPHQSVGRLESTTDFPELFSSAQALCDSHAACEQKIAVLLDCLDFMMQQQSDIMIHNYQVRSKVPVVGPLIAWVRRNLTSHLKGPYLDPTLRRQVKLNQTLIALLRNILTVQAELDARLTEMEQDHA